MDIINKVLGLFLGNKYERDIKEITPYTIEILKEYDKLKDLSNDQLRELTFSLKKEILEAMEPDENEIRSLKNKAEAEEDVYRKEEYYNEVDKIEKLIEEKLEKTLDNLVPRAFAIVKETARRFKENSFLEVTALQYDRDLAATRESITIKGEMAIWSNHWITKLYGIWSITMFSLSAVLPCIREKLRRWPQGKVKPWWQRFRFF
jgi:preprotein translocase subunit SecA